MCCGAYLLPPLRLAAWLSLRAHVRVCLSARRMAITHLQMPNDLSQLDFIPGVQQLSQQLGTHRLYLRSHWV